METSLPSATPGQTRSYMSEMLSELANLAKGLGDIGLERSLRLLALEVLVTTRTSNWKDVGLV